MATAFSHGGDRSSGCRRRRLAIRCRRHCYFHEPKRIQMNYRKILFALLAIAFATLGAGSGVARAAATNCVTRCSPCEPACCITCCDGVCPRFVCPFCPPG
jgi:hypothetical protein